MNSAEVIKQLIFDAKAEYQRGRLEALEEVTRTVESLIDRTKICDHSTCDYQAWGNAGESASHYADSCCELVKIAILDAIHQLKETQ